MAEKKKYGTSGKNSSRNTTKKTASGSTASKSKKVVSSQKKGSVTKQNNTPSFGHQVIMILLAVLAIFIAICFIFPKKVGVVGYGFATGFFGLFGIAAFLIPVLMIQIAYFWKRDVISGAIRYKYVVAIVFLLFCSVIIHTFRSLALHEAYTFASAFKWEHLKNLFSDGRAYKGGGFIGGVLSLVLICAFGYPGALIFGFLFAIVFGLALFGLTPTECVQRFVAYQKRNRKKRAILRDERATERAAERERRALVSYDHKSSDYDDEDEDEEYGDEDDDEEYDEEYDEDEEESSSVSFPVSRSMIPCEVESENYKKISVSVAPEEDDLSETEIFESEEPVEAADTYAAEADEEGKDLQPVVVPSVPQTLAWDPDSATEEFPIAAALQEAFDDGEEVSADVTNDAEMVDESEKIEILPPDPMVEAPESMDEDDLEEIPVPKEYEFPSIELLQPSEEINNDESVDQELRENADKIIETLDNFHVRVGISHVSRGPTVTRYELEPSAGTRVRSITNLLDDIALSLATSGVRSDGIITGKSAIGIEVPNKTVNTVYIRALIEDERFADAKSRLTTCLGMDVSGAPVYLDIAKMPHLLIAGATGMGKSVCINSLLVSLLYKARPEEVKLILIDPKKVELNIYNGIPHLLVPVVFDPKKAAGALHWAVTEMERRFELIESKNTRNIAQYNAAIANDPSQEALPQIVIIIDELADLMMSAPDDVEASICRLAQKARAAGMHLIIGTQRPSVDVITGLIKANIPSRIAFTVASQIDSRTIIDTQGAEKLIGRGDMLYAPVGASKPVRVQGAFVSETEIEEIVGFIRDQKYGAAYSDDVMSQINRAAEICGQKKGKSAAAAAGSDGGAEDNDPMLDSAIELAVEMGKISTSQMQRRLQVGYGRAAKLIDIMERRGIVSAPDGQKPRNVLITREQYLEMQMNRSRESKPTADTMF